MYDLIADQVCLRTLSSIKIRPLEPEDAVRFRTLRMEALKTNVFISFFPDVEDERQVPLERFVELLKPSDKSVFVGAFDGRSLVGYGRIFVFEDGTAEVGADYVSPLHRRRRVWTCLSVEREYIALAKGCSRLVARCRIDNLPIQGALREIGFGIDKIIEGRMCSGEMVQGYEMSLALPRPSLFMAIGALFRPKPRDKAAASMLRL